MTLSKRLLSLTLMGIPFLPNALGYPSSEGSSRSEMLFMRDRTTAELGDYTGNTSSYPDGSGTYVESMDEWNYRSGVKCWTDIVRARPIWSSQRKHSHSEVTQDSTMSPMISRPKLGHQRKKTQSIALTPAHAPPAPKTPSKIVAPGAPPSAVTFTLNTRLLRQSVSKPG